MSQHTIRARFAKADQERMSLLATAREHAALTIPEILPPIGWGGTHQLPIPYTSKGAMGVTSIVGKMLTSLFPASVPWSKFVLPGSVRMNPNVDPRNIQAAEQRLFLWDLIVNSALESQNLGERNNNQQHTLRSRKRETLETLIVVGDTLEEIDKDLKIRLFRLDQYVTRRDSSGNVVMHAIKEMVDPFSLPKEQLARARFAPGTLEDLSPEDRPKERYRIVEWQPQTRKWVITHEMNDHTIHEEEETVSPFVSTVFSLAGGSSYGTGFVKRNFSDLNTLNELKAKLLDILAQAAKSLTALDYNAQTDEQDMAKPPGSIVRARVEGGQVQDVAALSFANVRDYQMLTAEIERTERNLGRAFLVEDSAQPRGDRVTRLAIERIAAELDGATGGLYAPIASQQQIPLIARAVVVLQREALLPPMPKGMVEISTLTGLPAIAREQQAQKLVTYVSLLQQMGPQAMSWIDQRVFNDVMQRYMGIYEPGMVLTPEQHQQQQNRAIRDQVALAGGEQAVATAGRILEQQVAAGQ